MPAAADGRARHRRNVIWVTALALATLGVTTATSGRPIPRGTCPSATIDPMARDILNRCDVILREARTDLRRHPSDGVTHLRLAISETRRADLLVLVTYETSGSHEEYRAWRERYLRLDPNGAVRRAAGAARAAAHCRLDADRRRQALLLLAAAERNLGNVHGEAAARAEAVRREPGQATLWVQLADAYSRARQFNRAQAAMARAERLL